MRISDFFYITSQLSLSFIPHDRQTAREKRMQYLEKREGSISYDGFVKTVFVKVTTN